jgi:hypothetical protein
MNKESVAATTRRTDEATIAAEADGNGIVGIGVEQGGCRR